MPQIIKIDTFTSNYTKIFPFFHIKIHNKIWGFPSDLRGCWGQMRPWKIKVSKFQIWHHFYKKINCSYSQKCNYNVCEMHRLWNMIFFHFAILVSINLFVMLCVSICINVDEGASYLTLFCYRPVYLHNST